MIKQTVGRRRKSGDGSKLFETGIVVTRKTLKKRLMTGQTILITPQDERILRTIYDFISGYTNRKNVEAAIEIKRREVETLKNELSPRAKLLMKENYTYSSLMANADPDDDDADNLGSDTRDATSSDQVEGEIKLDEFYQARNQLIKLEERLKVYSSTDHKISPRDIDGVCRSLGVNLTKKQIEQMIWEVDETIDGLIDFDEFQLTYYRNITDTTGSEPCFFFMLLNFMIFDGSHKGYIIEDDCMEILYGRYGGSNLERDMKELFGMSLRAEGGNGTLNFETYLESVVRRIGKRALV